MEFVADRCFDMRIGNRLRSDYHWSINDYFTRAPSETTPDRSVLQYAIDHNAGLLTQDRDFANNDMQKRVLVSRGVILVRLSRVPKDEWAQRIVVAFRAHEKTLRGSLLIVAPDGFKIHPFS